jgi:serine/threonine protein kinase
MDFTVENVCGFLIRSKLLTPDEVKAMYARWQAEGKEHVADLARFTRWLVANGFVTEYQAAYVAKGQADSFFINQYKILDRLGRGRMAGVYKAVHQLGQVVAIKVLPPSKSKNPQMLGRFQREVKLAVKLKHPNVVRSFQVGETNGLHYLVMEYLEGETLDVVLARRKRLPAHEAVRVIYQALQGLQHIHEQGLVHRDLKPANLMLVPVPAAGEPDTTLRATLKILDIGLGRALDEGPGGRELNLTGEGMILGTPDYLAPEQARDPRAIDVRADIYSLGCVLYHCLTGQPPFPDTNVLSQMVRHATEAPRPLKDLAPDVPDGLQQIVNWMLAKDPNQRYPTPERAAQALQVFQTAGGEPVKQSEEGPKLKQFLTWVETDGENGKKKSARSTPVPRPAAAPPAPVPAARKHHGSKKHKKHKTAAHPAPSAQPAAAPSAAPSRPADFDVELVPVAPPAPTPGATPPPVPARKGLGLSTRDWLMLGFGAFGVIVAGALGFVLANALR